MVATVDVSAQPLCHGGDGERLQNDGPEIEHGFQGTSGHELFQVQFEKKQVRGNVTTIVLGDGTDLTHGGFLNKHLSIGPIRPDQRGMLFGFRPLELEVFKRDKLPW